MSSPVQTGCQLCTARCLAPLRLDSGSRDGWCDAIVERQLPKLEPTLPLFSEETR